MKFNILLIFGLVCLVGFSLARPAEEEYAEYEEEPEAPPPPKKPAGRVPLTGRRSPLSGRNNKATSTTSTAAPKEEEPAEESDYVEEEQADTSSTTETSKKFIKGGIVRPFRSNDELLATLKRRREQAVGNKHSKPQQAEPEEGESPAANEPAPKPAKNNNANGRRNRYQKEKATEPAHAEEASTAASPARTGRRFNSRS